MDAIKMHAIFGLALIAAGILFDIGFVTTTDNFKASLKEQTQEQAWKRYAYDLVKLYLFVLGFLSISFALLAPHSGAAENAVAIFWLTAAGSVLMLAGGLWEAHSGPAFEWGPPCYVLTAGLGAVLLGIALEIQAIAKGGGA